MDIILIEPTMEYADEIWAFRQEVIDFDEGHNDRFAGCFKLEASASAEEWINVCNKLTSADTCNEVGAGVPSHQYILVREEDKKVLGIFDIREHINHPILSVWGGHCGYTVRPSERGKGYATKMLELGVKKAKELGIPRILVTCDTINIPSEKTIIANGGVYEKTIEVEGNPIKRYWIDVTAD